VVGCAVGLLFAGLMLKASQEGVAPEEASRLKQALSDLGSTKSWKPRRFRRGSLPCVR
jgi:hypothetical protein